jgi:hypothetical protein
MEDSGILKRLKRLVAKRTPLMAALIGAFIAAGLTFALHSILEEPHRTAQRHAHEFGIDSSAAVWLLVALPGTLICTLFDLQGDPFGWVRTCMAMGVNGLLGALLMTFLWRKPKT